MNQADAQIEAKKLAEHFGIKVPRIEWTARAKRGRYNPRRMALIIGPRAWRTTVASFVHEFAHHLQWMRYRERYPDGNPKSHGEEFRRALRKVVEAFYPDPAQYPWHTEYRSIRGLGRECCPCGAAAPAMAPIKVQIQVATTIAAPTFSPARAVAMYQAGSKVVDIAVAMGYERGQGQNRTRTALIKASVYKQ